jgi:hypothetical protein
MSDVPSIVHEALRSPGQPLDAATRAFMEPRFGRDFSGVRMHTDARAAESARAVNALAYTVGHTIVFGAGQYAPGTPSGQRLLAHELAHTIQQLRGPDGDGAVAGKLRVNDVGDPYEKEADVLAEQALAGDSPAFSDNRQRKDALTEAHSSADSIGSTLPQPALYLARVDCSTIPQSLCKGIHPCGHGGSGKCFWGGAYPNKRCMCFGSTQRTTEEAERWVRESLPAWILALLSAAALALLIACFATGVCEAAALIGAVGAAAAAVIIVLLRKAGVDVDGASGEAPVA